MKRTIYNASFEESEKLVDDNYIIKMLEENEPKRVRKRVFGMIFTSFLVIVTYYFTKFISDENPNSVEIYSARMKFVWIIWGTIGIVLILFFYLNYNQRKLVFSKNYNLVSMFLILGMFLQVFSMSISLVIWQTNSMILVVAYCILFVLFPIIINNKINKKITKVLYNKNDNYNNKFSNFTLLFEKYTKKYGGILLLLIVIFKYFQKRMGLTIQEGGLMDMILMISSPWLMIGAVSFTVGFKEDIIQGHYLNKYYEEYRQKFGFSIEEWYGRHSKMYKNHVKEQQKS